MQRQAVAIARKTYGNADPETGYMLAELVQILMAEGRHEEAEVSGRRAVQLAPGVSIVHGWLAAPLAKLGRLDEAKAAVARLVAIDPSFSISRWSAAVGIAPHISDTVTDALRLAGLPE